MSITEDDWAEVIQANEKIEDTKMTNKKFALTDENMAKITDLVKTITGLNHLELKFSPSEVGRGYLHDRLYISSNNLVHYQYPRMFKRLEVVNFGGEWNKDGTDYWLPIQYHYEHFSSGTNGSAIIDLYIDKTGKILRYASELEIARNRVVVLCDEGGN
jgi:hypothetical protein